MAFGDVRIDYDKIIECGNQLAELSTEYNNQIEELYRIVDELKSSWLGDRATRYTNAIESDREVYKAFGAKMNHVAGVYTLAGTNYKAVDSI